MSNLELSIWVLCTLFLKNAVGDPPLCDVCACQLDYSKNYYDVNCSTDATSVLFEGIYWIDPNDESYPYKNVFIQNNNLNRLDKQFPKSYLTVLTLTHCSIDYISDSVFSNLFSIAKLVLSYNVISNFHPRAFQGFKNKGKGWLPLKQLFLDHNKINSLSSQIFKSCPDIEILNLAHNPLQNFDSQTAQALKRLVHLKKLDLSHTQLATLPSNFLQSNAKLRYLDLSGNQFLQVPEGLNLQALKVLIFDNNPLTVLDNVFPNMSSLATLHMSGMPNLEEIGAGVFKNLINLQALFLHDNERLNRIDKDAFLNEKGHVRFWISPKELYLQNNKLSVLDMELLEWDDLERMDLTGNLWSCDCESKWMIEDLLPNVLLKLDPEQAENILCGEPTGLASKSFSDIFENQEMDSCWTFHKHLRSSFYDLTKKLSSFAFFNSIAILAVVGIFWYIKRS